ncbi:MAG: hypothetical protein Q9225_005724 [Loekoesia sp. 1 TL-2023]
MSTTFSAYRDLVNKSLSRWPELSWLNRFLQTPKPADGDETFTHVFELVGVRLVECQNDGTAASLSRALESEAHNSRLRIVLIGHGDSWDVDRDILDVVCSKYSVDPRFLARHFDYPGIQFEKNCPRDFRHAIQEVSQDCNKQYTWDLGGDVMSHLSLQQLGSCFLFAYDSESLSLATHQEDLKVTLLVFVRAPRSELVATSRIFFHYWNAGATGSPFLDIRPPMSLYESTIRSLSELKFPAAQQQDCLIAQVVLPYITNLAGCCKADYHRNIAPRALKNDDYGRIGPHLLLYMIRQLVTLRQEVEAFLARFCQSGSDSNSHGGRGRETCRLLSELIDDSQRLLSFHHERQRSLDSNYLGQLIQAQIDEAQEAKKTSAELGRLSQLAYIFLPLQLTASAMGMNLKDFGTGNIELRTFLLIFGAIATLSFIPMLYSLIHELMGKRISQIRAAMRYSRRAGFLFGWFCLFHRRSTNDKLWRAGGIPYDLDNFRGRRPSKRDIPGEGWAKARAGITAIIKSGPLSFLSRYWQGVLDELYDIIDSPQWGKKDPSLYTA